MRPITFSVSTISSLLLVMGLMQSGHCQIKNGPRELNTMGIQFQSEGKLKEAVECYRKAIALNGQAAGYHNNLALALKDLGQLKEAETEARLALKLRPQRSDYHFNLGIILQRQRRTSDAEVAYREALQLDPSDADCHFRLAQTLFEGTVNNSSAAGHDKAVDADIAVDADKAVEEVKLALMLKPDRPEYCQLLGDIYLKEKKFDEAFIEYKKVADLKGYTAATIPGELKAKIDFIRASQSNK